MAGGPTQNDKDEAIKSFKERVKIFSKVLKYEQKQELDNLLRLLKRYPLLLEGVEEN